MNNTIQKVESYLPVFNGFYNSIWQFQEDNLIYNINQERKENNKNPIDYDLLNIDYTAYENDIVQNIIDVLSEKLKPFVDSIEFQKIISPKEYNFKNDSVNVLFSVNTEEIKKYIYNHLPEYKEYLKNTYTGCDGYIPFYENDFESWKEYTKDFSDFTENGHYLGSILEFIAEMEEITEYSIYEEVTENCYAESYLTNYQEIIEMEICTCCDKEITDKNILIDIEKYNKLMGKNPLHIYCSECLENY